MVSSLPSPWSGSCSPWPSCPSCSRQRHVIATLRSRSRGPSSSWVPERSCGGPAHSCRQHDDEPGPSPQRSAPVGLAGVLVFGLIRAVPAGRLHAGDPDRPPCVPPGRCVTRPRHLTPGRGHDRPQTPQRTPANQTRQFVGSLVSGGVRRWPWYRGLVSRSAVETVASRGAAWI